MAQPLLYLSPSRVLRGRLGLLLRLSLFPLPQSAQRTGEASTGCVLPLEAEAACDPGRPEKSGSPGGMELWGTGVGWDKRMARWKVCNRYEGMGGGPGW